MSFFDSFFFIFCIEILRTHAKAKTQEKEISNSVRFAQHPIAGQNMQHQSHKRLSSFKSHKLKTESLSTFLFWAEIHQATQNSFLIWQCSGHCGWRQIADNQSCQISTHIPQPLESRYIAVVIGVIPLRAKGVGEFIEIRQKKVSPTRILGTLECL